MDDEERYNPDNVLQINLPDNTDRIYQCKTCKKVYFDCDEAGVCCQQEEED